ncbi:MAG: hypothetical protein AAF959_23745 [Cyanobacteria bacterium P01_D01_bin.56]
MAFIPILLVGFSFMTLTALFSGGTQSDPPPKTPEQKLADAIAEYMKSREHDESGEE